MSASPESPTRNKTAKTEVDSGYQSAELFPVLFLPLLVLLLAFLVGVLYSPIFSSIWSVDVPLESVTSRTVIPIKRVSWSPKRSILEYLEEHPDEPVIFENTQAELWRARRVWKPSYLKRIFSSEAFVLEGAYAHNHSVFGPYFDGSKPMNIEGVRERIVRANEHRLWSPTAERFFSAVEGSMDTWNYFATKLRLLPSTLLMDIEPFDKILELDPDSQEENMNFWIGQGGVSAACHYDGYDNINVQVYGRKQWNMYAPSNHTMMYLYPFLHFHHAQTQVDIENPDLEAFPLFNQAVRYEGITEPGDAIYMPAMWFHGVQTLNTSINVNSWVKTPTSHVLETMASEIPNDISIHAAQLYLRQLLVALDKPLSFVSDSVVTPRYQRLFETGQLDTNGGRKDDIMTQCLRKKSSSSSDTKSDNRSSSSESSSKSKKSHRLDRYENVSPEQLKKIRNLAEKHASLFHAVPHDTVDIWLGNHIEYILAFATQDPVMASAILLQCF